MPKQPEPITAEDPKGSIAISVLRARIQEFNERYQDIAPHKRRRISEEIARPGSITDYLKALHGHTCQLCGEQGFIQTNGLPYIEAHHIIELHRLVPGSYCSDNIVVVCPNCHRKLHYARVSFYSLPSGQIKAYINDTEYRFTRSTISFNDI